MIIYVSCLLTPVIAELIKLLGLFFVRGDLDESEDGLIYGATIGLGFAATETMLYGIFLYPSYGLQVFIYTVLLRTVSVGLLHASVGAVAGYGITRAIAHKHKKGSLLLFPVFLLISIGCHSGFNYIANSTMMGSSVNLSYTYALIFSIVIASVTWIIMWVKIIRLDRLDNKPKDRIIREKRTPEQHQGTDPNISNRFIADFGSIPGGKMDEDRWAYSPDQIEHRREEAVHRDDKYEIGFEDERTKYGEYDKDDEYDEYEDEWDEGPYEKRSGHGDFDEDDFF